eukprot:487415-Prorocentrum_minimum.AAC.2
MEVYIQTRDTSRLKPQYHSIYLGAPFQAVCWMESKSSKRFDAASATATPLTAIDIGPARCDKKRKQNND